MNKGVLVKEDYMRDCEREMALPNRPGLLWLTLSLALIIQRLS
jgi:hypothetical protein